VKVKINFHLESFHILRSIMKSVFTSPQVGVIIKEKGGLVCFILDVMYIRIILQ